MMLNQVYPTGTKIRVELDYGDVNWMHVDFMEFENVAPAASNPDPTHQSRSPAPVPSIRLYNCSRPKPP